MATGKLIRIYGRGAIDARGLLILDGLLALGELVSWTMIGVGGIGWFLNRRRSPTIPAALEPQLPTAADRAAGGSRA
jgi:hypothetical protein